jgi:hypothetical protein
MTKIVSAGLVALWAVCITLRGLAGDTRHWGTQRRALTSSQAHGLEWRSIKQVGPHVVAVRLQLVIA